MDSAHERRTLYPKIEAYDSGMLPVSDIHSIFYEQSGNKDAKQTALVIHGGPGGGISPFYRQFFDPEAYRVVLFDQRGAGKSTPHSNLVDNTTWHSVSDIEKLREHLGIEKWVVFGGSWGSTLSLAYSEAHPERVKALVLRGIFALRRKELLWFYQEGADYLFPDAFEKYLEPIPVAERGDIMSAYHRRLTGDDPEERKKCGIAWSTWEKTTSRLFVDQEYVNDASDEQWADAFARIECHYFVNAGFFKYDGQVLAEADILEKHNIPGIIVQGRYDVVCPAKTAWDLKKTWPSAELKIIPDAGHSCKEDGIIDWLVRGTDMYRDL